MTREAENCYAAEHQLWHVYDLAVKNEVWTYDFYGYTFELPHERKFADLESIQSYVEKVLVLPSVKEKFPGAVPPKVRSRSNGAFAHYDPVKHQIAICEKRGLRWGLRELVVLHELAHSVVPGHDHDATFRGAYVFLVERAMGAEVGMVLGAIFHQELDAPHIPVR